jgi:hypothetical protein
MVIASRGNHRAKNEVWGEILGYWHIPTDIFGCYSLWVRVTLPTIHFADKNLSQKN